MNVGERGPSKSKIVWPGRKLPRSHWSRLGVVHRCMYQVKPLGELHDSLFPTLRCCESPWEALTRSHSRKLFLGFTSVGLRKTSNTLRGSYDTALSWFTILALHLRRRTAIYFSSKLVSSEVRRLSCSGVSIFRRCCTVLFTRALGQCRFTVNVERCGVVHPSKRIQFAIATTNTFENRRVPCCSQGSTASTFPQFHEASWMEESLIGELQRPCTDSRWAMD